MTRWGRKYQQRNIYRKRKEKKSILFYFILKMKWWEEIR
jgi:hypothetical protein